MSDATDFIRRLTGAWDCCATCAGGVLAQHDAEVRAKVRAESDQRADTAFLVGARYGREAERARMLAEGYILPLATGGDS